ncbi:uncharacterized protein [Diabrotica undecimpunctata]|uniref:uncharacterized protein n=1 Tax=Diabrotica undecimpunctata TaxID=50387 RepID=UPI003B63CD2E
MSDFTAKIGAGDKTQYIGAHRLGVRNERGDLLEKFSKDPELVVTNTLFQLSPRKLYTWKSPQDRPGRIIRNQINHILVPNPKFILGDLNGHNTNWGSFKTTHTGKKIEKIINTLNLAIINDGSSTHLNLSTGTFSSIDISLCTPTLQLNHNWYVEKDLHGSDHFPILIEKHSMKPTPVTPEPKWRLDKADWRSYQEIIRNGSSKICLENSIDEIILQFNKLITEAALEAIGKTKFIRRDKVTPWWNEDCKEAIKESKKALQKYKRYKSLENLINLKECRAKAKLITTRSKRQSWIKYVETINNYTSLTNMEENKKYNRH